MATATIAARSPAGVTEGVARQYVEDEPRRSSGPMLVAYFASQYYSGLRPEEAAALSKPDLDLPLMELNKATGEWEFVHGGDGWGWLLVSRATPTAGSAWTDTGERRERRQLKQRAQGKVRPTPSPPPLTRLLHAHLRQFGTAADGRLFRNLTGGQLAESTVNRVWDRARKAVLTRQEYESVLCKRPYDLRHACVSFQLAAGVPAKQVAEWNGHSRPDSETANRPQTPGGRACSTGYSRVRRKWPLTTFPQVRGHLCWSSQCPRRGSNSNPTEAEVP